MQSKQSAPEKKISPLNEALHNYTINNYNSGYNVTHTPEESQTSLLLDKKGKHHLTENEELSKIYDDARKALHTHLTEANLASHLGKDKEGKINKSRASSRYARKLALALLPKEVHETILGAFPKLKYNLVSRMHMPEDEASGHNLKEFFEDRNKNSKETLPIRLQDDNPHYLINDSSELLPQANERYIRRAVSDLHGRVLWEAISGSQNPELRDITTKISNIAKKHNVLPQNMLARFTKHLVDLQKYLMLKAPAKDKAEPLVPTNIDTHHVLVSLLDRMKKHGEGSLDKDFGEGFSELFKHLSNKGNGPSRFEQAEDKLNKEKEVNNPQDILNYYQPEHFNNNDILSSHIVSYPEEKKTLPKTFEEIQKLAPANKNINFTGRDEIIDPSKINRENPPHLARPLVVNTALKTWDALPDVLKKKAGDLNITFSNFLNSPSVEPGSRHNATINTDEFWNKVIGQNEQQNVRELTSPNELHIMTPFQEPQTAAKETFNSIIDGVSSHLYHNKLDPTIKSNIERILDSWLKVPANKKLIGQAFTKRVGNKEYTYNPEQDPYSFITTKTTKSNPITSLYAGHLFNEIFRELLGPSMLLNATHDNPRGTNNLSEENVLRQLNGIYAKLPILKQDAAIPLQREFTNAILKTLFNK